jgi:hypothetical protein
MQRIPRLDDRIKPEKKYEIFTKTEIVALVLGGICFLFFALVGSDLYKGRVSNLSLGYFIMVITTLLTPYFLGAVFYKTFKLTLKKYAICLACFIVSIFGFALFAIFVNNFKI